MMTKDIEREIVNRVQARVPEAKLQVKDVVKTNDRTLRALIIENRAANVSPTIYLDNYIDQVQSGVSYDAIVESIMKVFDDNKSDIDFDTNEFADWNRAKEKLAVRLVNKARNEKLLSDCPHRDVLGDLAIVATFITEIAGQGTGSILIHNGHAESWEKSADEVLGTALSNSPNVLPWKTDKVDNFIAAMSGKRPENDTGLIVLTNEAMVYGASAVLYPGVLKQISEKMHGTDFYILPSSVHEVLLLPVVGIDCERSFLDDTVKAVNYNTVSADEVLGDHAYYYDAAADKVTA